MNGIYFKAALRNIAKNKLYSAISITGLALGIAVSLMIALFIRFETSFDTAYPDSERIYRINWENLGTGARFATFFNPVSPILAENLPDDIEAFTRIAPNDMLVSIGDLKFAEELSFVDPNFFEMFPSKVIAGNLRTAFDDVQSSVITKAAAEKIYGTTDVIGRTFTVEGQYEFKVAAVIENAALNTHLNGNIFIHIDKTPELWGRPNIWQRMRSDQFYHYIKLKEGVTQATAESHIIGALETFQEGTSQFISTPLQPLTDIHFTSDLQNETSSRNPITGDVKPFRQKTDIYIFASVALLTFAIAAFNFMNMQILQITNRVKEVGIRKTLGATRRHVINQFLLEAGILAVISLLTGLMLVELALPLFAETVAAPLTSASLFSADMLALAFGATFASAAFAGLYPALLVSKHLPSTALRGEVTTGNKASSVRSSLIVIQFAIAIGLISASGIVNGQLDFALSKALGFDGTNVITVAIPGSQRRSYTAMKTQLEADPNIASVTSGSVIPTGDLSDGFSFSMRQGGQDVEIATRMVQADAGYFETLGMQMVAGRAYSEDFPADKAVFPSPENPEVKAGLILNEAALKKAGFENPASAVGQQMWVTFNRGGNDYRMDFTLVGVVKDAHYRSIRSEIAPISYFFATNPRTMIIKAKEGRLDAALKAVDQVWAQNIVDYPIEKAVLSDTYSAFYAGENRTFGLFIGFAGLAVLIACLGLWGLTSYIIERRTKEIGIRKVMGATVRHIVSMLTWDFSKLVIIANVIAWPAAWWIMSDWLSNFAYQSEISVVAFVLAAVIAFIMATVTTSSRALVVAQMSPADTLRQT